MPEALAKGLRNVYLDNTQASFIDGEEGILLYRGYTIHDLATQSNFEEVSYLLLYGTLPTKRGARRLRQAPACAPRSLPQSVVEPSASSRTPTPWTSCAPACPRSQRSTPIPKTIHRKPTLRKSERLTAQFPTIVAAHHRIRQGLEPVAPRSDLSHAANFLYMLDGKKPEPEAVDGHGPRLPPPRRARRQRLSLRRPRHGLDALRPALGIVTAIGTLKGPLHGGAAEAVQKMALEIGDPEPRRVHAGAQKQRESRIMGFGHRVYRAEDPRARHMRERSKALGEKHGPRRSGTRSSTRS